MISLKEPYGKYAECCDCHRWLRLEVFEQIEDYSNGHICPGGFHHQAMCITCRIKADEATDEILRQLEDEDIKVGLTD